ncbi:MAG: T9SS type A sorting domain-containing protein [bacterium]|nr:MAG: T9SS type A sorting domain-containing protein [bacterium]
MYQYWLYRSVNTTTNFQLLDIINHPDSSYADITDIEPGNSYAYTLLAIDSVGNQSDFSDTVVVGLPLIDWQLNQIRNNQSTYLPLSDFLFDPDNTTNELTLTFMNMSNVYLQISNGNLVISPDPYNFAGQCNFDLEVRDPMGFWDTRTIQMSILQTAPTSVRSVGDQHPTEYHLFQNYPNPFNPSTTIKFAVPERAQIGIDLYNGLGEKVQMLLYDQFDPGYFELLFDAKELSAGIYFIVFTAKDVRLVKRLLLVK